MEADLTILAAIGFDKWLSDWGGLAVALIAIAMSGWSLRRSSPWIRFSVEVVPGEDQLFYSVKVHNRGGASAQVDGIGLEVPRLRRPGLRNNLHPEVLTAVEEARRIELPMGLLGYPAELGPHSSLKAGAWDNHVRENLRVFDVPRKARAWCLLGSGKERQSWKRITLQPRHSSFPYDAVRQELKL